MAAVGEGVLGSGGAPGAPLDVTFVEDRGVLDQVRNTSVGLCSPRIERGRRITPTVPAFVVVRGR